MADVFDLYRVVIEETGKISARRRQLDSLYVGLITLILTGEAYVAFNSAFNNWLLVAVTTGAGAVGFAITRRWRRGTRTMYQVLDMRYQFLRELEGRPELQQLGAEIFSREYNTIYKPRAEDKRFQQATLGLQGTFIATLVIIPVLLAALTIVTTIPAVHQLLPPGILQDIRPLTPSGGR